VKKFPRPSGPAADLGKRILREIIDKTVIVEGPYPLTRKPIVLRKRRTLPQR